MTDTLEGPAIRKATLGDRQARLQPSQALFQQPLQWRANLQLHLDPVLA